MENMDPLRGWNIILSSFRKTCSLSTLFTHLSPPLPVQRTRIFIFHFQHKSLLSMCIVMSNIYSVVDVVVWYEPLGRTWLFTLNLSFCSKLFFIQMIQKMIQIRSIEWWSQQTVISSLLFSGRCTFFLLILEISPQTFHSASSRPVYISFSINFHGVFIVIYSDLYAIHICLLATYWNEFTISFTVLRFFMHSSYTSNVSLSLAVAQQHTQQTI